jgi:hypothetical protein
MEENPFVDWVDMHAPPGKPKTFFVPDDNVLKGIYKKFETDREAFERIPSELAKAFVRFWDKDNLKANGIKIQGKKIDGVAFSEERTRYHTYQYIKGFLSTPELSRQLKEFLTTKYDFSTEYKDVLQQIARGHLKGKDLIAFCLSSKNVNTFCNRNEQALFKNSILQEFGLNWAERNYGMTPRDLYVRLHKGFYKVFGTSTYGSYVAATSTQSIDKRFLQLAMILASPTEKIGTRRFIFFFPEYPELSFYAETKMVKPKRSQSVSKTERQQAQYGYSVEVASLQDTQVIESHISRRQLLALVLENAIPGMISFQAIGNSAWYAELTGDHKSEIFILKV